MIIGYLEPLGNIHILRTILRAMLNYKKDTYIPSIILGIFVSLKVRSESMVGILLQSGPHVQDIGAFFRSHTILGHILVSYSRL